MRAVYFFTMAKDPAFLFYSSDFLTGTMFMSNEQVGKYIRLLCAQHQMGHLLEKDMINICGSRDEVIFNKFKKDDDGKYFNERCENEILKRRAFSDSRSRNRKSKTKHINNISKTYVEHMENENENENEIVITKEAFSNFEEKFNTAIGPILLDNLKALYPNLDIKQQLMEFRVKCDADPKEYHSRNTSGLRAAFQYQLRTAKNGKQSKQRGFDLDAEKQHIADYIAKNR